MAKTMNDKMNELGIKICPKCGKEYTGYPALSRVDNKTEICSLCGTREAMEAFAKMQERSTCIFEKKECKFANKIGNVFTCTAPDDDSMTCR